eukprot:Skav204988  [mRNA]  locus=scaffold1180:657270:667038:- [translate_table: standard]
MRGCLAAFFGIAVAAAASCSGNDAQIWSQKGSAAFSGDMEACGRQCALSTTECASECVQKKEGYTSTCAKCFGDVFGCTREHCKLKCLDGQSAACKDCVKDAGCAASFATCSGFQPPSTAVEVNCTGAADPRAKVCYEGSAQEFQEKETVHVKIDSFKNGQGIMDLHGSGAKTIACLGKAFTKSGQNITTDLSDCSPALLKLSDVKYCSDQDVVSVTATVAGFWEQLALSKCAAGFVFAINPTRRRQERRQRSRARRAWWLHRIGVRTLTKKQITQLSTTLSAHHSRDRSLLAVMAASSSQDWWCGCGRHNPKTNHCCGTCGAAWKPQPSAWRQNWRGQGEPYGEWWAETKKPKSPRAPRPHTPKPWKPPKQDKRPPKQPQGGAPPPMVPAPPPQMPFPPQWQPSMPQPSVAIPSYQGGPTWNTPSPAPAVGQPVSLTAPPVPSLDPAMRNLLASLRKCSDNLPPEVQQMVTEVAVSSDRMEAKELHNAVNKLSNAKKQLKTLQGTRLQLHSAWSAFVQQATANWQGYIRDFGEQDQALQEQINAAKEQLSAAKENLQQSKAKATDNGVVEEISDDDGMRDEVGKEIKENLNTMAQTLDQLKSKADASIDDLQQPLKARKLDSGNAAPGHGASGEHGTNHGGAPADGRSSPSAVEQAHRLQFECGTLRSGCSGPFPDLRPRKNLRAGLGPVKFSSVVSLAFAPPDSTVLYTCRVHEDALLPHVNKSWALDVTPSLHVRLGLDSVSSAGVAAGMRLSPALPSLLTDVEAPDYVSFMQAGYLDQQLLAVGLADVIMFQLREGACRHRIQWFPISARPAAVADALGVDASRIVGVHPLPILPHGDNGRSPSVIVQFDDDLTGDTDESLIFVEIMSHLATTSAAVAQLPHSTERLVYAVPHWISRQYLLQRTRVSQFCASADHPCHVFHNGAFWSPSETTEHDVEHGDVLQIHLPAPSESHPFELDAFSDDCSFSTPDEEFEGESTESEVESRNASIEPSVDDAPVQAGNTFLLVWYIHHLRAPTCAHPRLARVSGTPDLIQQLANVWQDHFVSGTPARVSLVHPQPCVPTACTGSDPLHAILEQGLQGSRSTAVISIDPFLAETGYESLTAWSLPYYFTGDLLFRTVQLRTPCLQSRSCLIQHADRVLSDSELELCPSGAFFQIRQRLRLDTTAEPSDSNRIEAEATGLWQTSQKLLPSILQTRILEPHDPEIIDIVDEEPEIIVVVQPGLAEQTPFIRAVHGLWTRYQAVEHQEEGPIAYFSTFYLSSQRQVQCRDGRPVRLCADFHEWTQAILDEPDPDYLAALLTVTHDDGLVTHLASFAPRFIHARQALRLVGVPLPVCLDHPLLQCRVWYGDNELEIDGVETALVNGAGLWIQLIPRPSLFDTNPPDDVTVVPPLPIVSEHDGLIDATTSESNDSSDESSHLQLFSKFNRDATSLSLPLKPSCPFAAPSGVDPAASSSASPYDASGFRSEQSIPSVTADRLIRPGAFIRQLLDARSAAAVDRPTDSSASFLVESWYISFDHTVCRFPRRVALSGPESQWMAQLHRAWRETINPDHRLHFYVVTPKPVQSAADAEVVAHVLLVQNLPDTDCAVLVTTLENGTFDYCALKVPTWLNRLVLLAHTGNLVRCQDPTLQLHCFTWFAGMVIRDTPFFQAFNGFGFALGIFRVVDPSLSLQAVDAHQVIQTPPNLQNHVHIQPGSHPSAPIGDGSSNVPPPAGASSSSGPVRQVLSLDDLLPQPFTAEHYLRVDVSALMFTYRQLLTLTLPPPLDFGSVVKWHENTICAVVANPVWTPDLWRHVTALHLYTDGTSVFDRACSVRHGAASVVLVAIVGSVEYFVGFQPFSLDSHATAQRSEHAAILGGLVWLFTLLRDLPFLAAVPVTFWFDNVTAGYSAGGFWVPNVHTDLAHLSRCLVHFLGYQTGLSCTWQHVPAHKGWPWNEAADATSWAALNGWIRSYPIRELVDLLTLDSRFPELPQWLWFLSGTLQAFPGFPLLHQQALLFPVERPFQEEPKLSMLSHPSADQSLPHEPFSVIDWTLQVAQANVLTLYPQDSATGGFISARQEALLRDFELSGVHVVGVQETRCRASGHRLCGQWHIISAPATAQGTGGVQLWIRTSFLVCGRTLKVETKHLKLLHSSSRRLIVLFRAPWLHLRFVVGHAPHEEPGVDLTRYWKATSHLLRVPSPLSSALGSDVRFGDLNWNLNVHDHAVSLHRWIGQFCAPSRKSVPRKTHLTDETWRLVQLKKFHRKRFLHFGGEQRRAFLSFLFHAWSQGDGATSRDQQHAFCTL